MGTKYELGRRPSSISLVMPSSEKRKWRVGSSKGELRIGFSMTTCVIGLRTRILYFRGASSPTPTLGRPAGSFTSCFASSNVVEKAEVEFGPAKGQERISHDRHRTPGAGGCPGAP